MKQLKPILLVFLLSLAMGCKQKMQTQAHAEENTKAMKMLQGVWVDGETLEVNFMIKGDSIFYPDSTSQPARFKVVGDSLVIGEPPTSYPIVSLSENILVFKNQNGEELRLNRSGCRQESTG